MTLTCPTCPLGMNVQILPEGERLCRTCGTRWSAEDAAQGHAFTSRPLTPGWCTRCGCAEFVHEATR